MRRFTLPDPPRADDQAYRNNPLAYSRAVSDWLSRAKGALENTINHLGAPARPSFVVSSYTTNTVISGTTTGTDLSNAVCSLIAALTTKGTLFSN